MIPDVTARLPKVATCAALAFFVSLLVPSETRADDEYPEVTIDENGPNRPLPVGPDPYYLKWNVPSTVRYAAPIFVRVASPPWGIGQRAVANHGACNDIGADIVALLEQGTVQLRARASGGSESVVRGRNLFELPAAADVFFENSNGLQRRDELYFVRGWERSETDKTDTEVRSFVNNESFFLPGSRYCLIFAVEEELPADPAWAWRAVFELSEAMTEANCAGRQGSGKVECALSTRRATVEALMRDGVRPTAWPDAPQIRARVSDYLANVQDAAAPARQTLDAAGDEIAALPVSDVPLEALPGNDHYYFEATSSLARVVLNALADEHHINVTYTSCNAKPNALCPQFRTRDHHLIEQIRIELDISRVTFGSGLSSGQPTWHPTGAGVSLAALPVGTTGLTVRQLIQFARGDIRGAAADARPANEVLEYSRSAPMDSARVAEIDDLRAQLARFRDILYGQTGDPMAELVDDWKALRTAYPEQKLDAALKALVTSVADATALVTRLTQRPLNRKSHRELHTALQASVAASQETFVSQYVSTVTARVWVPTSRGHWRHYQASGMQLFFRPNESNVPMWSRGWRDLARLPALEVTVGNLADDALGPRFSGAARGSLPPVQLGLAAQIIPYTTLSTGVAFYSDRATGLSQERWSPRRTGYVSVSLGFTSFDSLRRLFGNSED